MPAAIEPADDPIARDLARFRARGEAFVFVWTVACALVGACAIVGVLGHSWWAGVAGAAMVVVLSRFVAWATE